MVPGCLEFVGVTTSCLGVFVKTLGLGVELEFAHAILAAVWVFCNYGLDNFPLNVYLILWTAENWFSLVRRFSFCL